MIAGQEYGGGSSRDWAAQDPGLPGVRVVVTENFERIPRTNLAGLAILPLPFAAGVSRQTRGLTGRELFSVEGIDEQLVPGAKLTWMMATWSASPSPAGWTPSRTFVTSDEVACCRSC